MFRQSSLRKHGYLKDAQKIFVVFGVRTNVIFQILQKHLCNGSLRYYFLRSIGEM